MTTANPHQVESVDSFLSEVKEAVRLADVLMILAVPTILSLVYLLPESIQHSMVLNYENPSLYNLLSSAYVHRGFDHFINNLMSAFLIVPIYLLFVVSDERKLFHYTFWTLLLIVPVIIALINVVVIGRGTGAGFSGIGSAIMGLLPVGLLLFVHNRISERIHPSHGTVLFLIPAATIAFIYNRSILAVSISVIAGIIVLYNIYHIGGKELRRVGSEIISSEGYFLLIIFTSLMYFASPLVLFPQSIDQGNFAVNILSHYLGLVIGFFGPTTYLTFR